MVSDISWINTSYKSNKEAEEYKHQKADAA